MAETLSHGIHGIGVSVSVILKWLAGPASKGSAILMPNKISPLLLVCACDVIAQSMPWLMREHGLLIARSRNVRIPATGNEISILGLTVDIEKAIVGR